MDLAQGSMNGLLHRITQECRGKLRGRVGSSGVSSSPFPEKVLADAIKQLGSPMILVVDEVDQLVPRGGRSRAAAAGALDALVELPHQQGLPPLAIIMIANAVDLLERTGLPGAVGSRGCASVLFEPYTASQLRQIVKARLPDTSVDGVSLEMRVRQVAKNSGDCRQALVICEEARSKSGDGDAVKLGVKPQTDPLRNVQDLPMEQQVLLCALTGSKCGAAMRISEVCISYKDLCRKLRQPASLASRGHISSALSALEQRGLLSLQTLRGRNGRRASGVPEVVAEVAVAHGKVRERLPTFLQHCLV